VDINPYLSPRDVGEQGPDALFHEILEYPCARRIVYPAGTVTVPLESGVPVELNRVWAVGMGLPIPSKSLG